MFKGLRRFAAPFLFLSAITLFLSGCVDQETPGNRPTPTLSTPAPGATPPAPSTAATATTDTSDYDPSRFSVEVTVSLENHHPISPWIYGLADSSADNEEHLRWLGTTLLRWGGNARSRHNWEVNASNAGSDWEFRNVSQGDDVPGSASLLFMQRNQRLGARSLLTIPTIGWVAKDGDNDSQSVDVPEHGGPRLSEGSDAAFTRFENGNWSSPYDPAANQSRTSVRSLSSKGSQFSYPPDLTDGKVYQDEWVAYLRGERPPNAPPPIYAMDNEPELWSDSTHVDVHPTRLGYDDQLANFLEYARAVKNADPEGLVAGPESWGVTAYMQSALDEGGDNYRTAADKAAHGGLPWLEWFLKEVRKDDIAHNKRSLDILDVHYYPQGGIYGSASDPETQNKRLQAPRMLWDSTYTEPSWVARTEWAKLALIRRLQRLVEQNYPGTKLGISEWNFGGEEDISGAIAVADTLGIFGREGVYSAAYWGKPGQNTPAGWAFRIFRNYDGKGASFGTESMETNSSNTTEFSAYGARTDDKITVVLINKRRDKGASVTVKPEGFDTGASAMEYRYGQDDLTQIKSNALQIANPLMVKVMVPPMSISLLAFDR